MRGATGNGTGGPGVPAFVRRLGEAGYGPGDGCVGTLDLLARSGFPVPDGFVLTVEGHREFIRGRPGAPPGGLGGALEREIRAALLELGARTVVVGWERGARRGLGTIPAVVAAVREAWTPTIPDEGPTTWPVLVQRQARPDITGWTTTGDLVPDLTVPSDAPLHDVEPAPGRRDEGVSRLTRRAAGVLGGAARLGWGLEGGRWLLISVDEEAENRGKEEAMFPTRILLATDGSEEAMHAGRTAAALAQKTGSELHVVYVEHLPETYALPEAAIYYSEMREETRKTADMEARKRLAEEVEKLEETGGVVEAHARIGRPDAEISHLAEEIGAGLIVVGSRGLGPIRRLLVGSVSNSVVHHAHSPVLVVRDGGDSLPRKMLLAVDGSEESRLAAAIAAELSAKTGAETHVVHVLPSPVQVYGRHYYSADMKRSLLDEVERDAREFLDRQAERISAADGKVGDTHLLTGHAPAEIVRLAEEIQADLTILGSRGLGGVRRALMGSVSDSVVHHAHNPVLVVREDSSQNG